MPSSPGAGGLIDESDGRALFAPTTIIEPAASRIRLRWLAPNAVWVTHTPPGAGFPPERPWLKDVIQLQSSQSGEPELSGEAPGGLLRILDLDGAPVLSEAAPPQLGLRRRRPYISLDIPKTELRLGLRRVEAGIRLSFAIQPGQAFYGFGEQFNAFQRRSGKIRLRIRDAIALLQPRGETYSGIPFTLCLDPDGRSYGLLLLNSHTSRWQIDPPAGRLTVEADGPGADYLVIVGPSFARILETYTALTGRPPLPPRWAFGLWTTSYPQGPQTGVLAHAAEHRQREIPLDAVILDYHWEERFHNFQWRRTLFPDPAGFIETLNQMGIRLGLITTPFLNARRRPIQKFLLNRLAHNLPPGLEGADERALPEYEAARQAGMLAHPDARWWFGAGGMPDFTDPRAANWWNELARPLYEQGVAFFKNDDGEYLPDDARSAAGMDGRELHNLYGFYYSRAMYAGSTPGALADSRRPLVYARSAWAGSQRFPALFLGDQKATFEGMRSGLRAGLNLSLQGFAHWTADTFGLDGRTTPEVHMRFAQWALFCPLARYFTRPPEIDDTRLPWSHNPEAEENFRRLVELRYRLLPYYYTLAWRAWQSGLPVLRPLLLEFQAAAAAQPQLAQIDDQAMLGEALMLCPILTPGAASRRILLPPGAWHDFWSRSSWQGPAEIDYPAPLDRLPLLVRGGSLLPFGPALQCIPDTHRFDELELHLWPPYPLEGAVYDDDGHTTAYQQGAASLLRVQAVPGVSGQSATPGLQVCIFPDSGSFSGQPAIRRISLVLERSQPPARVIVINQPQGSVRTVSEQFFRYDPQAQQTVITLLCPANEETRVEIT